MRGISPKVQHPFERKLGYGEQGVLNLAIEMQPDIVLIDDKKARNEAKDLGLAPIFTTNLLKWAKSQKIIDSYQIIVNQLSENLIYLPELGLWKKDNRGNREQVADGVIENFVQITRAFLSEEADEINDGLRRDRNWFYPLEAIRETVVNAFAHRDWSRSVDIEFSVYNNRLEVISPGALQNLMTVAKMIAGQRSPRNPLIVDVLRDYRYVDARGMGIRTKVIPLMRQINQTEPVFEDTEDFLKTTLFRRQED